MGNGCVSRSNLNHPVYTQEQHAQPQANSFSAPNDYQSESGSISSGSNHSLSENENNKTPEALYVGAIRFAQGGKSFVFELKRKSSLKLQEESTSASQHPEKKNTSSPKESMATRMTTLGSSHMENKQSNSEKKSVPPKIEQPAPKHNNLPLPEPASELMSMKTPNWGNSDRNEEPTAKKEKLANKKKTSIKRLDKLVSSPPLDPINEDPEERTSEVIKL
jgi:hypothetical protein